MLCAHCSSDRLFYTANILFRGADAYNATIGSGVELPIYQTALAHLMSNRAYWQEYNGYLTPLFRTRSTVERRAQWRVTGTLVGLFLIKHATAPGNLSPFLLAYMLFMEQDFFHLPISFVAALEPDLAARLAPWDALRAEDRLDSAWLRYFSAHYASEASVVIFCSVESEMLTWEPY
jgi:hypothetical protein